MIDKVTTAEILMGTKKNRDSARTVHRKCQKNDRSSCHRFYTFEIFLNFIFKIETSTTTFDDDDDFALLLLFFFTNKTANSERYTAKTIETDSNGSRKGGKEKREKMGIYCVRHLLCCFGIQFCFTWFRSNWLYLKMISRKNAQHEFSLSMCVCECVCFPLEIYVN